MKPRKLLQDGDSPQTFLPVSPDPPMPDRGQFAFKPDSPFDSSMGVTAVILLCALLFMGFFSLYIRRCTQSSSDPTPDPAPETHPPRRRAPPPTPARKNLGVSSTVGSIPLVSYGGEARDCVICLSEMRDGEMVRKIPCCGHVFHPGCVDTWLISHVSCPLCRSTNVFGVEEVRLPVAVTGDGLDDVETSTAEI